MRSSITNDIKHRQNVFRTEEKYRIFKAVKNSESSKVSTNLKSACLILMDRTPHFKDRIRKRCVVTGRGRGVYGKYTRSRIKVREYALDGYLACVKKTSW